MSVTTEKVMVSIVSPKTGARWLFQEKSRHAIKWWSTGVANVRIFLELYEKEDDEQPFMSWMVNKSIVGVVVTSEKRIHLVQVEGAKLLPRGLTFFCG